MEVNVFGGGQHFESSVLRVKGMLLALKGLESLMLWCDKTVSVIDLKLARVYT